jgi:Tfp pilus assembly major pilin PilA
VAQLNRRKAMKNQRGMTLISWILVLGIIAFIATFAMRLIPMYQEYMGVLSIMDSMKVELEQNKLTKNQVELLLYKKFDTGYISSVKADNIEISRGKDNVYVTKIVIDYEVRKPFMYQISLIGNFHAEVDVEPKK